MIRQLFLLFALLPLAWTAKGPSVSSSYYFDDGIVPCEGYANNDPLNGRVEEALERCTTGKRSDTTRAEEDEHDHQEFCAQISPDLEGVEGGETETLHNLAGYSKIANKNAIRQHDRFSGASSAAIYKKYFKKDMSASSSSGGVISKLSLIVDTDIGQFPDDPVAMAIVHGQVTRGSADLLAVIASTKYEGVAMSIDAVNRFFGRSQVPVGVTRDQRAYSDPPGSQKWTEFIRNRYQSRISANADAEDALSLYRRVLNSAPDRSVTILAIGHFINLANLLESPADATIRLTGYNLVRRKVREVIAMAGTFPSGLEWNIEKDAGSARLFAANWPTKVTFVGFEVGNVTCGTKHQGGSLERTNPIAASHVFGYEAYGSYEGCFDAVAALIIGRDTSAHYCAVYGQIRISPNGTNDWLYSGKKKQYHQRYLKVKATAREEVAKVNTLIAKRIDDYLPDI